MPKTRKKAAIIPALGASLGGRSEDANIMHRLLRYPDVRARIIFPAMYRRSLLNKIGHVLFADAGRKLQKRKKGTSKNLATTIIQT